MHGHSDTPNSESFLQTCDFGQSYTITLARTKMVDYLTRLSGPLYSQTCTYVTPPPLPKDPWTILLWPFHSLAWTGIGGAFVLMVSLAMILSKAKGFEALLSAIDVYRLLFRNGKQSRL